MSSRHSRSFETELKRTAVGLLFSVALIWAYVHVIVLAQMANLRSSSAPPVQSVQPALAQTPPAAP